MSRYGYRSSGSIEIKIYLAILIATLSIGLVRCSAKVKGNRDLVDTEKSFNYIIDYNKQGISLAKIIKYSDYSGSTVEISTSDGLKVLKGLNYSQLLKVKSYYEAYKLALELANGNESQILSYDNIQGLNPEIDESVFWNKNILNLNYDFDYAIIEDENGVTVKNISTWRDWDDDDKVQYTDSDDIVHLGTFLDTQLINSENASLEAVYNYALTLAGSEERLNGDIDHESGRALKLINVYNPSDYEEYNN